MPVLTGRTPSLPILSLVAAVLLSQGCADSSIDDGDTAGNAAADRERRVDIIASIAPDCLRRVEPVFERSDRELIEIRDSGCRATSTGSTGETFPVASFAPDGNDGPGDVEGSSFLFTGNNSARVSGATFGGGTQANATLTRSVPVRLETASAEFRIEAAHVVGSGRDFNVLTVVTNRSNTTLCDIGLGAVGVVDRDGEVFRHDSRLFDPEVDGSIARLPTGERERRCLAPGESSYANMFAPNDVGRIDLDAADVVAITVPGITFDDTRVTAPLADIVPIYYAILGNGRRIDVTVRNTGLVDVEEGFAVLLVLDANGYPIEYMNSREEGIVPAGGTSVYSFEGLADFTGRADTIRVIVAYSDIG